MQVTAHGEDGTSKLHCRLLVVADGAESGVRDLLGVGACRHEYHQTAIVANVTPTHDHGDTAFERFSPDGPLALLPLSGGRCVAVCVVATAGHQRYLELADQDFLEFLEKRFGRRLGRLTRLGSRRAYPLTRVIADRQIGPRFVLLGNAAHTLHPNGAQGFNLAVRDMAALAEQVVPVLNDDGDPGSGPLLEAYVESRRADQERVVRFSHGLARIFSAHDPIRRILCRAGILGVEFLPPLRHTLMRAGMGLYGRQPAWVRAGQMP
jgi:2-octaprenyl-6-methoxyphenol hydroxylase